MANKQLNAIITIGGALSGTLGSAIGGARRKLGTLNATISDLEKENRKLGKSMNDALQSGGRIGDLHRQYQTIGRAIDDARRKQERLTRTLREGEQARALKAQAASNIGATLRTGAVVGVPLLAAAKEAMEYDYQLQMIGNTADMTREQIARLDARITEVSKKTNQSAMNTQKAFGFLIAAGLDIGQASASLETVGKTATATGSDIEDVAKTAFTLQDALKIEPKKLQLAMDGLARAGKMGNFEMRDMSQQLPVLGSAFSALKMQGQDAIATLGAALQIARKGAASPEEAANNLNNYMAKLLSPDTLKKAAKFGLDLNKVIVDAQKNGQNPFEAATKALYQKVGNDQKKLGEIFADMQVQNFLRPMFQNMGEYEKIKNAALNSAGTVDADFAKTMGTTKEQVDKIIGSVGRLAIVLGEAVTSAFGGGGGLAENLDAMSVWIKANKELVGTVVKVGAGFLAMRVAVNSVVWAFASGKSVWSTTKLAFDGLRTVGPLAAKAMGFLGKGLLGVGRVLLIVGRAMLMNPIGLTITAIAVGAFLLWKYWKPISGFFKKLWADITAAGEKAWVWFRDTLLPFTPLGPIVQNWEPIGKFLGALWEGIKGAIAAVWTWIKDKVLNYTPLGLVIKNWEPIGKFFKGLWDGIKAGLKAAIDWIFDKIAMVGEAWQAAKRALGLKADGKFSASTMWKIEPASTPPAPKMPAMATARGRGGAFTDNSRNTYHIVQQPGQDGKALAKDVVAAKAGQRKQRSGGQLYDAPRGY